MIRKGQFWELNERDLTPAGQFYPLPAQSASDRLPAYRKSGHELCHRLPGEGGVRV
jgi:hypothetical protein